MNVSEADDTANLCETQPLVKISQSHESVNVSETEDTANLCETRPLVNVFETDVALDVVQSKVVNLTETHEVINQPESNDHTIEACRQSNAQFYEHDSLPRVERSLSSAFPLPKTFSVPVDTDMTMKKTCKSPGSRLSHLVGQWRQFYKNRFDSGGKILLINVEYVLRFKFNQCDCSI